MKLGHDKRRKGYCLVEQKVTEPQMFIDWKTPKYPDRTCAVLCRKVGGVVEILDMQFAPE